MNKTVVIEHKKDSCRIRFTTEVPEKDAVIGNVIKIKGKRGSLTVLDVKD